MCTVTFIPRRKGYRLGMNRDEQLTRPVALPPKGEILIRGVLYPAEPTGGTWVALNENRICLALINWYSVAARVTGKSVSRGKVILSARDAAGPDPVQAVLETLPLAQINPFRLIGIFPGDSNIIEWRWDLKKLTRKKHPWKMQQWISSGFNEPGARRIRGATFRKALRQPSAGSAEWLRRLHRSHEPEVGPFSICMHRDDAMTVSYTEISVSTRKAMMRYHAGAPCGRWL